jgi:hypothetical protein
MVWADVAKYFSATKDHSADDGQSSKYKLDVQNTRRTTEAMAQAEDFEALRPPYIHVWRPVMMLTWIVY